MAVARRAELLVLVAFAVLVLIGGVNFLAVTFSNRGLPPLFGAAVRFGAAAILFVAFARLRGIPLPQGRALVGAALYGALAFGVGYAFAYYALVGIGPGLGSVVMALVPLLTVVLASAQGAERLTARGVAGATLAAAGIAVVFFDRIGAAAAPIFLVAMFCGAVAAAETGVVVKRFPRVHPAPANAVGMAVGAAILAAASLVAREPWHLPATGEAWAAVAWLVLPGSLGLFALYLYVLGRWTASATSYLFVVTPLVAIPLGAWFAGESVTVAFLAGAAIVAAGVWIGALKPVVPAAPAAVEPAAPKPRPPTNP